MPSAVFLLTGNVSAATGRLVTSPKGILTYTFSEIIFFSSRWFLDIEKSVLLELKGVKIIRSYRDFVFFI